MARRRKGNPVHGWVVLDKPYGAGSTAMVGKVRWLFQAQKAGHAGTLDPLASGILPIALGEATKTVPFMMNAAKSYEFTITWGQNTTTQDAEGDVTARSDVRPSEAEILAALPEFRGQIEQVPPKFSAIKVDGKRAYDLARAGETVELSSRAVQIDRYDLVSTTPDTASFEVDCGKGTYIRSLARDLAVSLGACAHVTVLRRTRVGLFNLERALTLDALQNICDRGAATEGLCPVVTALDDIPALAVTSFDKDLLKQGRAIICPPDFDYGQSDWVLTKLGEIPIALCHPRGGQLVPKRVFNM
ncbi:MAG: tRNA pseudouridine(55) synthase TruB [Litorimonas sp.]